MLVRKVGGRRTHDAPGRRSAKSDGSGATASMGLAAGGYLSRRSLRDVPATAPTAFENSLADCSSFVGSC